MPRKKRPRAAPARKRAAGAARRIDLKMLQGLYDQAQALVNDGVFLSLSEFGRTAIREKLAALGSIKKK